MWYPVTVHCASSASSSPLSPRLVPVRCSVFLSVTQAQGDLFKSLYIFLTEIHKKSLWKDLASMFKWWDTKYFRLTDSAVMETLHPNPKTRKHNAGEILHQFDITGPQCWSTQWTHTVVLQCWSTVCGSAVWSSSAGPPCGSAVLVHHVCLKCWSTMLVHTVVLRCWSTLWSCSAGPPRGSAVGPQCWSAVWLRPQTGSVLLHSPPATTGPPPHPSSSACISWTSPVSQVHVCQSRLPHPTVTCAVLLHVENKRKVVCLFVCFLTGSILTAHLGVLYILFLISVSFGMNYLKLTEGIVADICHTFVMYMQEFVFYFLLFFSCVLFIWLIVGFAA